MEESDGESPLTPTRMGSPVPNSTSTIVGTKKRKKINLSQKKLARVIFTDEDFKECKWLGESFPGKRSKRSYSKVSLKGIEYTVGHYYFR